MERLIQPDRVIKSCIDAGFLKTVEVGQYFMTKQTDEFLQIAEPVTCREYTLPRQSPERTWHGYQDPGKSVASDDQSGNLRNRHHQVIQKMIVVNLGLLKSGKVELRSTIDQGNLRKLLGI